MPEGAVLVLGMHRSGTSALTRGLEVLGVELGKNLKPGIAGENDKGFFEDWTLSAINDELLALSGEQWDSLRATAQPHAPPSEVNALKIKALGYLQKAFGAAPWFAFKDPRSCRNVAFWEDVVRRDGRRPFFIIAFRNPMSVARSLQRRNGFSHKQSYNMWLVHYARIMEAVRDKPHACVEYDEVMREPGRVLERVACDMADPTVRVSLPLLAAYETEFLDPKLRNHVFRSDTLELDDDCSPMVADIYAMLQREAAGEGVEAREWEQRLAAFRALAPHFDLAAEFGERVVALAAQNVSAEARAARADELEKRLRQQEAEHANALDQALQAAESRFAATLAAERENARAALEQAVIRHREQYAEYLRETMEAERDQAVAQHAAALEAELRKWEAAEEAHLEAMHEAHRRAQEQTREEGRRALVEAVTREREHHAFAMAEALTAERELASANLKEAIARERAAIEQLRADAHVAENVLRAAAEAREQALIALLREEQEKYEAAAAHARQTQEEMLARIDGHTESVRREQQKNAKLEQALRLLEAHVAHTDAERQSLAEHIRALRSSTSWRLTAPLRLLSRVATGKSANEPELVLTPAIEAAAPVLHRTTAHAKPAAVRRVHFTICAKNYLPIARTCLESAQRHHPEADHVLVLCDEVEQGYEPNREPFRVVTLAELGIIGVEDMRLRYDVMELSTAIKPFAIEHFFQRNADEVVYLDPDLYFLAPMQAVRDAFDTDAEAVVTPHITAPVDDGKNPNERDMLRCGVFNLGFLALKRTPDVSNFVRWWGQRLRTGSVSDPDRGLFTDQKWCDLLPCFIEKTEVLRHPGYNLAYWNLMQRPVARNEGMWTASGELVCFVHFSGASFNDANVFSKHQDRFDANGIGQLRELYDEYRNRVRAHGFGAEPQYRYAFDFDPAGRRIAPILRRLYRSAMAPDGARPGASLDDILEYCDETAPGAPQFQSARITRLLHKIWTERPDLQQAFDLNAEAGQQGLVGWAVSALQREYQLDSNVYPLNGLGEGGAEDGPAVSESPIADLSRSVLAHADALRPLYRHLPRRWRERAKVALTRSAYAAQGVAHAPAPRAGAALIGYARGELGMGEHVRMTAAALECHQVPMGIVNITESVVARQEDRRFDHLLDERANFRANIFHVNADQMPVVTARLGDHFLSGKKNIAYPAWELSGFPDEWIENLAPMQELWAPSRFIAEALAQKLTQPVVHMTLAVEIAKGYERWRRADFGIPDDAFVFMFHFDLASYASRKNPEGVINAFLSAFGGDRAGGGLQPMLLMKVLSSDRFPDAFKTLQARASDRRIVIVSETMTADRMHGLMNASDVFVSLHRSEGFGRGPAEAMRLGKAVIATGYSGNLDYMTRDNSFLVPYSMRRVEVGQYPFGEGQHWAEPDVDAAADLMRMLYENPAMAQRVGQIAATHMNEHHSAAAAGLRLKRRLNDLRVY